jgi:hypothetical protein
MLFVRSGILVIVGLPSSVAMLELFATMSRGFVFGLCSSGVFICSPCFCFLHRCTVLFGMVCPQWLQDARLVDALSDLSPSLNEIVEQKDALDAQTAEADLILGAGTIFKDFRKLIIAAHSNLIQDVLGAFLKVSKDPSAHAFVSSRSSS